jgi:hypothetical protein
MAVQGGDIRGRGRSSGRVGLGLPLYSSMPSRNNKEKRFLPDPMFSEREIHCSSFSFFPSARGEEREREGKGLRSRVGIAGIQIQI